MTPEKQIAELNEKVGVLLNAHLQFATRLIVLEDAFVILSGKLAETTPAPIVALEAYIAELEATLTNKRGLQGRDAADAAFQIGAAFDNLVHAMRERVPGASGNRPAN